MIDPAFGWGLPPGVKDHHIDERFGDGGDEDESPDERRQRIEEEKGEHKADLEREE